MSNKKNSWFLVSNQPVKNVPIIIYIHIHIHDKITAFCLVEKSAILMYSNTMQKRCNFERCNVIIKLFCMWHKQVNQFCIISTYMYIIKYNTVAWFLMQFWKKHALVGFWKNSNSIRHRWLFFAFQMQSYYAQV